jgi:KUP system potassium uptake protein
MTWDRGRSVVTEKRVAEEGPLRELIAGLGTQTPRLQRVPGTAVYLHARNDTTPLALRINVERNHIRHDQIVILHARTLGVPHVPEEKRVTIDDLGDPTDRIVLVEAHFGFRDIPDLPAALRLAVSQSDELQPFDDATYFLSRITIHPTKRGGMAKWRKELFSALARNASSPAEYFQLPEDQVVALGSQILV